MNQLPNHHYVVIFTAMFVVHHQSHWNKRSHHFYHFFDLLLLSILFQIIKCFSCWDCLEVANATATVIFDAGGDFLFLTTLSSIGCRFRFRSWSHMFFLLFFCWTLFYLLDHVLMIIIQIMISYSFDTLMMTPQLIL